MKTLITASVVALGLASSAAAIELGNGLSLDSEFKAERNMETETNALTFATDLTWDFGIANVEVGPNIMDLEDIEFTGMEYQVTLPVTSVTGLEVYTKTTTDDEWGMGDISIGASFSFSIVVGLLLNQHASPHGRRGLGLGTWLGGNLHKHTGENHD